MKGRIKSLNIFFILFLIYCSKREKTFTSISQAIPKPFDVILLLDQSGSMKETDPKNNRIEAGRFLIDYISSYWSKEQPHRIGLINFGDKSPLNPEDEIFSLTSLDTANKTKIESLKQKIKSLDLGNTKFIDALKKAKKEFLINKDTIPRQEVIIILTDGEPDDNRRLTREAYFRELISYYNDSLKNCHLYVIAIDIKDIYWKYNEPYWKRIAQHTERLTSVAEEKLKEAFWKVISMEMEAVAERWFLIPPEGFKVELDPYLENVTFTFHRELPDAEVSIFDPKGKKITENPPKIVRLLDAPKTVIWKIEEPMPGEWVCKVEKGIGKVEVGTAQLPIQPRLIYPKEVHPQGKPFIIWASFLRKDGKPIKEHRAYKLRMSASVYLPNLTIPQHFELKETKDIGIFTAQETIETKIPGEYKIDLKMTAHKDIVREKIKINVVKMPYIEVIKPKYNERQTWRKDVVIEAEIKEGGEIIIPTDYFSSESDPNEMIYCQIFDENKKEIINSGHLKYVGKEKEAKFLLNLGKIKKDGKYRIILKLRAIKKDGTIYEYLHNPNGTIIYRKWDIIDIIFYKPYFVILIILLALFICSWLKIGIENNWWYWYFNAPFLEGKIEIINRNTNDSISIKLNKRLRQKIDKIEKWDLIIFGRQKKERGKSYYTPFLEVKFKKKEEKNWRKKVININDSIEFDIYKLTYKK